MITSPSDAFISQDLLKFCGKNNEGSIRLTKAMDIKVTFEMKESENIEEGWLMSKVTI